jgi:hypothetical protein
MKECMCRFAKAATTAARCKDAGLTTKELYRQIQEAEAKGCRQDLLQFLDSKGPYKAINFRRQRGLINGKLFILPPAMSAFHKVAVEEWHRQNIGQLEKLPGFDAWFADWATPPKHTRGFTEMEVDRFKGVGKGLSVESRDIPGARNSEPAGNGHLPNNAQSQNLGGRPVSSETQEVYRFCWEARQRGEKRAITMRRANAHFGHNVIRQEHYVTIYASRYRRALERAGEVPNPSQNLG